MAVQHPQWLQTPRLAFLHLMPKDLTMIEVLGGLLCTTWWLHRHCHNINKTKRSQLQSVLF